MSFCSFYDFLIRPCPWKSPRRFEILLGVSPGRLASGSRRIMIALQSRTREANKEKAGSTYMDFYYATNSTRKKSDLRTCSRSKPNHVAPQEDMHLPAYEETGCSCRGLHPLFGESEVALKTSPSRRTWIHVPFFLADEIISQSDTWRDHFLSRISQN